MDNLCQASAGSQCLLLDLPLEILVEILSHCDGYFTLKLRVAPTCRTFRDIIQHIGSQMVKGSLAESLFIDKFDLSRVTIAKQHKVETTDESESKPKTKTPVEPPDIFQLHPCLKHLRVRVKESTEIFHFLRDPTYRITGVEDLGFLITTEESGQTTHRFIPILDSSVAGENAISPSCDCAQSHTVFSWNWDEHRRKLGDGSRTKGVTVADLAKAIADTMTVPGDGVHFYKRELTEKIVEPTGEVVRYFQKPCIFEQVEVTTTFGSAIRYGAEIHLMLKNAPFENGYQSPSG